MTKKRSNSIKLLHEIKPKTDGQAEYIRTIAENHVTLCDGPAGSGKSMLSIGLACEYWIDQKIDKIIVCRPIIEAGRSIGYLAGDMYEKIHPFMLHLLDYFEFFIGKQETQDLLHSRVIELVPLNFMRGRTFNNSFMILDEVQNATYEEIKLFLTRIGMKSKVVLNGDNTQSDLPNYDRGGFKLVMDKLEDCEVVGTSKLNYTDIVRSSVISKILAKLE